MVYEVNKCNDDTRDKNLLDPTCKNGAECEPIDPVCAKDEEIAEWTKTKRLYV